MANNTTTIRIPRRETRQFGKFIPLKDENLISEALNYEKWCQAQWAEDMRQKGYVPASEPIFYTKRYPSEYYKDCPAVVGWEQTWTISPQSLKKSESVKAGKNDLMTRIVRYIDRYL